MKRFVLPIPLALLAGPALAHSGQGAQGFAAGVLHPLLGADHLLAMLAVGLWSGFILPAQTWAGAATFLSAMAAGAGLSWAGMALPGVEAMVQGSVVAFGGLVLMSRRGQGAAVTGVSLAVIAAFAAAHGHAHATEAVGSAGGYLGGFLLATGGLHLGGIGIARSAAGQPLAQKALGASLAGSGLVLAALG